MGENTANEYFRKINYCETDRMGITHHSNYVRFMEEARIHFLEQIGCGYDQWERNGIISPCDRHFLPIQTAYDFW